MMTFLISRPQAVLAEVFASGPEGRHPELERLSCTKPQKKPGQRLFFASFSAKWEPVKPFFYLIGYSIICAAMLGLISWDCRTEAG
jgi:hypothetical protein